MTEHCTACGRSLELVPRDDVVVHRESTGFGPHNERIHRFCSPRCRARYRGVDPVLEMSQQATLAAFDDSVDDRASRVTWGL